MRETLINLAKDMRAANRRGEDSGLTEEELAFYDALEVNDSAVKVLGDETLRTIAHDLVQTVRNNATIDWTVKDPSEPRCTSWSSAFSASTVIRRTSKKKPRKPC